MPRAIWKGSINFGLVFIPVSVYPATREEKISFKQLRATDLSPIKYKKVAEVDQKEVPADQIVKGYEFEKGKWVTLKDEDFEKVKIESTHSVEITDFVEQAQINPKFFSTNPTFWSRRKGAKKAMRCCIAPCRTRARSASRRWRFPAANTWRRSSQTDCS